MCSEACGGETSVSVDSCWHLIDLGQKFFVTWYCVLDCPGFNALPRLGDFALEGTMSIADLSAALKTSNQASIATLGWHADIPVDKPLRDMKDQYGYTMTDLKDRIKK
jgi:hypothetical protein